MGDKRIEFESGAREDVRTAVAWYQVRSEKAASEFIEELRRAVAIIEEAPSRWALRTGNMRSFPLWRFPFVVVYEEEESRIAVWAVAHGSRRPNYWMNQD
jgi:toxin ParE1/3/4